MTTHKNAPNRPHEAVQGAQLIKLCTVDDSTSAPVDIGAIRQAAWSLRGLYRQIRQARSIECSDRAAAEAVRRFVLAWDRSAESFRQGNDARAVRHFKRAVEASRVIAAHADRIELVGVAT